MKKILRHFLKKYLWFMVVVPWLFMWKKSFLHTTGWIESIKRGYPCGKDGSEVPWLNYAVINFLKERLNGDLSLFEFGSGYSTLFYAKLVRNVISVESDKDWFNLIKDKIPDNASLLYKEKDIDGIYCRSITEFNQEFDVVIVDGRDRVNCTKQAIGKLSKAGVIILDDSDRARYCEALEHAKKNKFRILGIEGLKPTGYGYHKTSILYRDDNCLNI
jgi:hypothetical protein